MTTKSIEKTRRRRGHKKRPIEYIVSRDGCHVCVSHRPNWGGYPRVKRNGKCYTLHRYVYEQCIGPIPRGHVVMHLCDNPLCMNPTHLKVGTIAENTKDAVSKKRRAFGEQNGHAKLTDQNVLEIQASRDIAYKELAKKYGVTPNHIHRIWRKEEWTNL